jgi:hypothetical protein
VSDASSRAVRVLKDFAWLWIAAATIVPFYVGMAAAGLQLVFWIVLAGVIGLVFAKYAAPALLMKVKRVLATYRKGLAYDQLEGVAAQQKFRVEVLESAVEEARRRGIGEGRGRVVAELVASTTQTSLKIVSMMVVDDLLNIAAEIADGDDPPAVGGAWRLLSKGQSIVYAVFAVMEIDATGDVTYVRLQQDRVLQHPFIADLTERARSNPDVGDVWQLRPRTVNTIEDLAREPDYE